MPQLQYRGRPSCCARLSQRSRIPRGQGRLDRRRAADRKRRVSRSLILHRNLNSTLKTQTFGDSVMTDSRDFGALVLRLALGVMFLSHSLLKIVVFTLPGTAAFFAQQGFP